MLGLRVRIPPTTWASVLIVVVSAQAWAPAQKCPSGSVCVCLSVIVETSIMRGPWPTMSCCAKEKIVWYHRKNYWPTLIHCPSFSRNSIKKLKKVSKAQTDYFPNTKETNFTFMWPCIVTNIFIIKPTRCPNFPNLFWHEIVHVSGSSSAHHQQFIHCTLGTGICHTGLKTAFEQDHLGSSRKLSTNLFDVYQSRVYSE
jgi:hypothetical protein